VACPKAEILTDNPFYHRTTLWHGQIFTSNGNKVRKIDPAQNSWQELEIPELGNCELFSVNDHLYAADHSMILEILDGGRSTHILASNRRKPPVSVLDTANLGEPILFAGPGGALRLALSEKIFTGDGTNWMEVCPAPPNRLPASVTDQAVLFFGDGYHMDAGIWRLPFGANQVEYCMGKPPDSGVSVNGRSVPQSSPKPAWNGQKEFRLDRVAAATHGTDIYLLVGRAKLEDIVDEQQHLITGKRILPQDGYHAELFCFSRNYPAPQKIFLKFNATDTTVPVVDDADRNDYGFLHPPMSWVMICGDNLLIGREYPDNRVPANGPYQNKVGIWVTPLEPVIVEVERQKQSQAGQLAQAAKAILDQFDWNHDGIIDGEEKEAALTNKDYIAWQLDQIDANQNGLLDTDELKFFDANSNNVLNAHEQTGIEIAGRLLAERLVRKFDTDGNGMLNSTEFENLKQNTLDQRFHPMMGNPFPDQNHDGFMDVEEVKNFLESQTESEIMSVMGGVRIMGVMAGTQHAERFKADVENYWQGGSRRHRPYGPGGVPPFMRPPSQSQPQPQTNQ
jgi:Ca2+-binding EF-hand superfamily protein